MKKPHSNAKGPAYVNRRHPAARPTAAKRAPSKGGESSELLDFLLPTFRGDSLARFYRQLNTFIRSGVPLVSGLNMLARQSRNGRQGRLVTKMALGIESGSSLADQFAAFPYVFPHVHAVLVHIGETSGKLEQVLLSLGEDTEYETELQRKFLKTLGQPLFNIHFACFAFPAAEYMTDAINGPTYLMRVLAPLSLIYLVLCGRYVLRRTSAVTRNNTPLFDMFVTKIPVLGPAVTKQAIARFCKALSAMLASGLMLDTSLEKAGQAAGLTSIHDRARWAALDIRSGLSLSQSFAKHKFPNDVQLLTATGEAAGTLANSLDELARSNHAESVRLMATASKIVSRTIEVGTLLAIAAKIIRIQSAYMG